MDQHDILVMGTVLSQFKFLCVKPLPERMLFQNALDSQEAFLFSQIPVMPKPKRLEEGLQKSAGGWCSI